MRMPLAEIDDNSQEKNKEAPDTNLSSFCFSSQQKSEKICDVTVQSLSDNDDSKKETEVVILSSTEVKQHNAKKRKSPIKGPTKVDEDVTCAICSSILNSFTLPERESHVNLCMDKKVSNKNVKKSKIPIKSEVFADDDADSDFADIFSPKSSSLLIANTKSDSRKVQSKAKQLDGRNSKSTTVKHRGKKILSLGEAEQIEHVKALSLSEVTLINNLREQKLEDSDSDMFVTSSSPTRPSGSSKDKKGIKFLEDDRISLGSRSINELLMDKGTKSQQKSSNKKMTDEDELQRLRLLLNEISAREATDRVQKAQTLKTIRKIMKKPKKIIAIDVNLSAQDGGAIELSVEEKEAIKMRNMKSLEIATDILFPFAFEDQKDYLYLGSDHNSSYCQHSVQDVHQKKSVDCNKNNEKDGNLDDLDKGNGSNEDIDNESMNHVLAVFHHCPLWGLAQHREVCDRVGGEGFKIISKAFQESFEGLDGFVLVDEGEDWVDSQPVDISDGGKDDTILDILDDNDDSTLVGHSSLSASSPPVQAPSLPSSSSSSSALSLDEVKYSESISTMSTTLLIKSLISRLTATSVPRSVTSSMLSSHVSPLVCMLCTLYKSLENTEGDVDEIDKMIYSDVGGNNSDEKLPGAFNSVSDSQKTAPVDSWKPLLAMSSLRSGHDGDIGLLCDHNDYGNHNQTVPGLVADQEGSDESNSTGRNNDDDESNGGSSIGNGDDSSHSNEINDSESVNMNVTNVITDAGINTSILSTVSINFNLDDGDVNDVHDVTLATGTPPAPIDALTISNPEVPQCSEKSSSSHLEQSSDIPDPSNNQSEHSLSRGRGLVQLSLAIPNSPFPCKDSLTLSGTFHSSSPLQPVTALSDDENCLPLPLPISVHNSSSLPCFPSLSPSEDPDSDSLPLPLPISSMKNSSGYHNDRDQDIPTGFNCGNNEDTANIPLKTIETNFADYEFKGDLQLPLPLPLHDSNDYSGNDNDSCKIRIKNDCKSGQEGLMERNRTNGSNNDESSDNSDNNNSLICTMEGGVSMMNKTTSTSSNNSNNNSNENSQICTLEGGVSIINKSTTTSSNNSNNNSQICTLEGGVSVSNIRDNNPESEGTDISDSNNNVIDNSQKCILESDISHVDTKCNSQPAGHVRKAFDMDEASKISTKGCKIKEEDFVEEESRNKLERSRIEEVEIESSDIINHHDCGLEYGEENNDSSGNYGRISTKTEPVRTETDNYLDLCSSTPSTSQRTPLTPLQSVTKNDCDESQICCLLEGGYSVLKNNLSDSNNNTPPTPNSHEKPYKESPSSAQSHSQYSTSWEPSPSILFSPKENDNAKVPYGGIYENEEHEEHQNDEISPQNRKRYSGNNLLENCQGVDFSAMDSSRVDGVVGGASPGCSYEELEEKLERLQRAAMMLESDEEQEEEEEEEEEIQVKEEIDGFQGRSDGDNRDMQRKGRSIDDKSRKEKGSENVSSKELMIKTEISRSLEERKIKEEVILTVEDFPDKAELLHSQRVRTGVKRPLASAFYKPPSSSSCSSSSSRTFSVSSSSTAHTQINRKYCDNNDDGNDYPQIQIDAIRDCSVKKGAKGDDIHKKFTDDGSHVVLDNHNQTDQPKNKNKGGWGGWNSPKKVMTTNATNNDVTNKSKGKSSKSLKKKTSAVGETNEEAANKGRGRDSGEVVIHDDEDGSDFFYGTQKQKEPIDLSQENAVPKKSSSREPLDLTCPPESIISSSLPSTTSNSLTATSLPPPVAIADMFKSTLQPDFDVYTLSELHQFGALYGLKKDTKSRLVKILESMWRRTQLQSSSSSSSMTTSSASSSTASLPSTTSSSSSTLSSSSSAPASSGPSKKSLQEKESSTCAVTVAPKAIRKPRAKKATKTQESLMVALEDNSQEGTTLNVEKIVKKRKKCSKNDENALELLNDEVMEYIKSESDLYMQVLCFEPLDVDALQERLKNEGRSISKDELVNILDSNALFISINCVAKQRQLDKKAEKKEQKRQIEIRKELKNNEKNKKQKQK